MSRIPSSSVWWSVCALVASAFAGCGGGSGGPAAGAERGPCYGNGTCNTGLVCLSSTCVKPMPTGTAGTTGAGGAAGATGSGGTSGTVGTGGSLGGAPGTGGSAGAGTGGSGGTAGAGGSGGSAGAGGSAGTGGSAGAGGSAGTGASAGTGGAPSCSDYCTAIMANCTAANAQYTNLAECQADCPVFPVGTSADLSGNTLGCRAHVLPSTAVATPQSCAAAGPSGGNVCGTDPCVPYCALVLANCPGTYATMLECMGACSTNFTAASGNYSTDVTSLTDHSVYCYLGFAALAPTNTAIHCQHVVKNQSVCGGL